MVAVRIEVAGLPAPQGSKRHVGHGIMVESSRRVGPWREAVRAEVQRACGVTGHTPLPAPGQPAVVEITFYLPRPKSLPKRVTWPAKRPDIDKLVRATLDGIVDGGALADDAQIIALTASKVFAREGRPVGCVIYIIPPGEDENGDDELWRSELLARIEALEQAEMAARDALTERTGRG